MLITFDLLFLALQAENALPDLLTWLTLGSVVLSLLLYIQVSNTSSTKKTTARSRVRKHSFSHKGAIPSDSSIDSIGELSDIPKEEQFNSREASGNIALQELKQALQLGNVKIAVQCIVHAYKQQWLSWEQIISTIAMTPPQKISAETERQAKENFDRIKQPIDISKCLSALILYHWLAIAWPGNTPVYWHYQGIAYSFLPEDDDQANLFAAIACYQIASKLYERQRAFRSQADVIYLLGEAYSRLTKGDYQANLRVAIEYFLAARDFIKNDYQCSNLLIDIYYQLGLAYRNMPVAEQEQVLAWQSAQQHLRSALDICRQRGGKKEIIDEISSTLQEVKQFIQQRTGKKGTI